MARAFDGSGDIIACGTAASLADIVPFTYAAWIRPVNAGESNVAWIMGRNTSTGNLKKRWRMFDPTQMQLTVDRVSDADARSDSGFVPYNAWSVVFATYDETDGPRLYRGAAAAAVAEVTYANRVVGSGATVSDSGDRFDIGNEAAIDRCFNGRIAHVAIWAGVLKLAEMQMFAVGRIPRRDILKGYWPLRGDVSPEPDYSGNKNNGTVTNAVAADGPPAAFWFPMIPTDPTAGEGPPPPPSGSLKWGAQVAM